jgi:hypothetical protein
MGSFNIPGDAVLSSDGRTLLLTSGGERVAQRLRVGIKTVLGTYRYDMARGVPWFELLEKPNQALLRAALYDYFLSHPDVSSILSLEFRVDRLTRLMNVTYQLRMKNGDVVGDTTPVSPLGVST